MWSSSQFPTQWILLVYWDREIENPEEEEATWQLALSGSSPGSWVGYEVEGTLVQHGGWKGGDLRVGLHM